MFEIFMGSSNPASGFGVGDGWCFVVAKDVTALGDLGGGLGYSRLKNSFALGFDTFNTISPPTSNYYNTDYIPAIDFGKDGVWDHNVVYSPSIPYNVIKESDAKHFKPNIADSSIPFTADDINALVDKGATILNPGTLANARNYSIYA
jgi:hypothetical protein